MNPSLFIRLGSTMAGGGIIYAAYIATKGADLSAAFAENGFRRIFMEEGPLEVCAIGVLIWLLGKWRSNVAMR